MFIILPINKVFSLSLLITIIFILFPDIIFFTYLSEMCSLSINIFITSFLTTIKSSKKEILLLSVDVIIFGSSKISFLLIWIKSFCDNIFFKNSTSSVCILAIILGNICFWSVIIFNPRIWIYLFTIFIASPYPILLNKSFLIITISSWFILLMLFVSWINFLLKLSKYINPFNFWMMKLFLIEFWFIFKTWIFGLFCIIISPEKRIKLKQLIPLVWNIFIISFLVS